MKSKKDFENQITGAVQALCNLIPFAPQDAISRAVIVRSLSRMIETPAQLEWFVDEAILRIRKWEGVGQLRGLYCTRYKPADGLPENTCDIPGLTPADMEADYQSRMAVESERKLEGWKAERKLLAAGSDIGPFEPTTALRKI